MAFFVESHSPTINATGVYVNTELRITFNKRIRTQSVDWQKISVNDAHDFTTLTGALGVDYNASGEAVIVSFIPELIMLPDNKYNVYIFGSPNGILAYDGEQLEETYSFSFTTGTGIYDIVESGGLPSGEIEDDVIYTDLSGLVPIQESSITSFDVYSTDPKNQTPNVNTQKDKATVTFTGAILTDLSTMSGYITIEETAVLY